MVKEKYIIIACLKGYDEGYWIFKKDDWDKNNFGADELAFFNGNSLIVY